MLTPSLVRRYRIAAAAVFLACTGAVVAPARADQLDPHVARARALMQELRAESRRDAERIKAAYRDLDGVLADRHELAQAIDTGTIRLIPLEEPAFNIRPRMTGPHPIGELDRDHQHLYAAAQPAALGLLLQIAARVDTPLDITSLVRHDGYQRRLARTNANARTSLATHTFGLAFDISILNVSNAAAREIRDVLRQMRDAGDLFFIAEVRQLVFHVVVAPGRAPFHAAAFDALVAVPPPAWRSEPLPTRLALREPIVPVLMVAQSAGMMGPGVSALPSLLLSAGAAAAVWRRRLRQTRARARR